MSKLEKIKPFIYFIFFGILFFVINSPERLSGDIEFYLFQTRDISRAINLLSGQNIFYGPELTGGGNLPGPFYYYLIAIPLFFSKSWFSVWILFYTMSFISFYLLSKALFKGKNFITFLLLFFALSTNRLFYDLNAYFTNASFAVPFTAFFFYLIEKTKRSDLNQKITLLYLSSFFLGFVVQLHYSTSVLLLLILNIVLVEFRNLKPSIKFFLYIKCLLFFIIPLFPYLLWSLKLIGEDSQSLFISSNSLRSIPSLMVIAPNTLITRLEKTAPLAVSTLNLFSIFHIPALMFLILHAWIKGKSFFINNRNSILLFLSIFAFILYAFFSQSRRYLIPYSLSLCIFYAYNFRIILRNKKLLNLMFFSVFAYSAIRVLLIWSTDDYDVRNFVWQTLNVFSLFLYLSRFKSSKKYAFLILNLSLFYFSNIQSQLNLFSAFNVPNSKLSSLQKEFNLQTGHHLEDFLESSYLVNFHSSVDLKMFFDIYDSSIPRPQKTFHDKIDGLIYLNKLPNAALPKGDLSSIIRFLMASNAHPDLLNEILNGNIVLGKPIISYMMILPYRFSPNAKAKKLIQNINMGYTPTDDLLLGNLKEYKHLTSWNMCPHKEKYCEFGMAFNLKELNSDSISISLKIFGYTLSQNNPWVSQSWTQALFKPYILLNCQSGSKKYVLVESLGYSRTYSPSRKFDFFNGNNSILAPFHYSTKVKCKNLKSVEVGYSHLEIDTIINHFKLPGSQKVFNFN